MKNKIIESLKNLKISQNHHLLLAVSGGIDSMVMLDFFKKNTTYKIAACYVNHHFQSESDKMELLVSTYCKNNNISFYQESVNSSDIKNNIEAQLREKRYSVLEKVRCQINADFIVTAHHADDQIETILMKILNSSSFSSIGGIKPLNENILRPMLSIKKHEILDYAKQYNVDFIDDPTNQDSTLTRNYLRNKVIPSLKYVKDNIHIPFDDFQRKIHDIEDLLSFSTNEFIKSDSISYDKKIYYINKDRFLALPFLLKINIIKELISKERLFYYSKNLLLELTAFLKKAVIGSEKNIGDSKILVDRDFILLTSDLDIAPVYCEVKAGEVIENDTFSFHWDYDKKPQKFLDDPNHEFVDAENFNNTLIVRNLKNEDVFNPLGLSGSKKVIDYLTDQKISAFEKRKTIAICNKKDIVWIAGKQISNNYRLTDKSKLVAKLNFFRK